MSVRPVLITVLLCACRAAPTETDLTPSAEFFLANGGLSLIGTTARPLSRPCLKGLSMSNTLIGGVVGASRPLVDFVDTHHLATLSRPQRDSGYEKVVFTLVAPYTANWVGTGDFKFFCFGKPTLVKVEPVEGTQPITAGDRETYVITGTQARVARLTFRLDDVPGGTFTDDLKAMPTLLTDSSMRPEDYGQNLTVVATLPVNPKDFNVTP